MQKRWTRQIQGANRSSERLASSHSLIENRKAWAAARKGASPHTTRSPAKTFQRAASATHQPDRRASAAPASHTQADHKIRALTPEITEKESGGARHRARAENQKTTGMQADNTPRGQQIKSDSATTSVRVCCPLRPGTALTF